MVKLLFIIVIVCLVVDLIDVICNWVKIGICKIGVNINLYMVINISLLLSKGDLEIFCLEILKLFYFWVIYV